jgi:hypothetical protein
MTNTLRHRTIALTLTAILAILSYSDGFPQSDKSSTRANSQKVMLGAFTVDIPSDWKAFSHDEASQLQRQAMAKSHEIYRKYAGSDDPTEKVDLRAFHVSGSGAFVIVSSSIPQKSNLIPLLKSEVEDKMAWGIREGHIQKYLGLVSVDNEHLSGFYTKTIGKGGGVQISGNLEHKKLRSTIIQLTLFSPTNWDEAKAIGTLTPILDSVALRGK